jgi:hypothetical protein
MPPGLRTHGMMPAPVAAFNRFFPPAGSHLDI